MLLQLSFEILKPGLHWDAVQLLCHRTLVKGFQHLGIFKSPNSPGSGSWNSEEAILASGVSSAFFPHGVGHSLGMDVHDVPSVSKPKVNDTLKTELGHPVSNLIPFVNVWLIRHCSPSIHI
jgi:Xaa-Pro dipeptidase